MNTTIDFNYKGKTYSLEFTRKSIKTMEDRGFTLDDNMLNKPVTLLSELFRGAFLVNHKFVKPTLIDEILETMKNKGKLRNKLIDMYTDTLQALYNDEEESESDEETFTDWE